MKNDLRSRWFCGISYLPPDELKKLLEDSSVFDKYIFIYHHSDKAADGRFIDRHCHFIVQCRCLSTSNFLNGYFNDSRPYIRTLIQRCYFDCLKSLLMYMCHIGESKYQYPVHDLVYNCKDFFDKYIRALKCIRGDI